MFNNKKELKILEEKLDTLIDEFITLRDIVDSMFPVDNIDESMGQSSETLIMPEEIYDEIYKYCENKNFIFMGVS